MRMRWIVHRASQMSCSSVWTIFARTGTYSVRLWYPATDEIVDLPGEVGVGEISRVVHAFQTISAEAYFDGEWWR